MKKSTIILIVIGAVILLMALYVGSTYNSLVSTEQKVNESFANIDVQLERRAELIPNLVNTVKGYTKHESEVIDSITTARQNLLNAKTVSEKSAANNELTSALNALAVVVENYPDLKASANFQQLQDELAGTENRIATSRRDYNESVTNYNTKLKRFPSNLIANMFGFTSHDLFTASESSQKAPNVEF